jgi:hypothetical protein
MTKVKSWSGPVFVVYLPEIYNKSVAYNLGEFNVKRLCILFVLVLAFLGVSLSVSVRFTFSATSSTTPTIFFTDLISGPNGGGESSNGTYVTIYGNNFGLSPTVTVGGGQALIKSAPSSYQWYQKMTIQLNSASRTGNIIITNANGSSNGVSFTIRSGSIYCVSTGGNDANPGTFSGGCWRTIPKARHSRIAGDIVYLENGVTQTTLDDYASAVWLGDSGNGTSANPIAFVVYPGASVTIGANSGTFSNALRGNSIHGSNNYFVIAGLNLIGPREAIELSPVLDGWRIVGNNMTCPNGSGQAACFHANTSTNVMFYGNNIHDIGSTAGLIDKYYHAVYFTTNANHIDVGWNTIVPNPVGSTTSGGCRAIQFYSTGGSDQFDLHVHDNLIHDAICDGINFATVNANAGTVEAYNNVVYHTGTGPDPGDGASNYSCVNVGSSSPKTANVELYNNSFYDCGSRGNSNSGALSIYTGTRLRNNIVQQKSGEPYLTSRNSVTPSGSNNEWFGSGNGLSQTTANINADPRFVSIVTPDLHLQSGSPAINSGMGGLVSNDKDGIPRPQGSAYDIGAYEYLSGVIFTPTPTATPTPSTSSAPTPTPTPTKTPTPSPTTSGSPAPSSTNSPQATPSSTPTSIAILGDNKIESKTDFDDSNYMNAVKFTMPNNSGSAQSISVYVASPVSKSPNNQSQVAIYSNNNGTPGTLIASSVSKTITADGWATAPISALLMPNTTYWLTYNSNGNSSSENNWKLGPGSTKQYVWKATNFGTWPSTFGTIGGGSSSVASIYLTYTLPVVVSTPTPGIAATHISPPSILDKIFAFFYKLFR